MHAAAVIANEIRAFKFITFVDYLRINSVDVGETAPTPAQPESLIPGGKERAKHQLSSYEAYAL